MNDGPREIDWAVLLGDWDNPSYFMHCLNDYLKSVIPHLALQEQLRANGMPNSYQETLEGVQNVSLLGANVLTSVLQGEPEGELLSLVKTTPSGTPGSPS